MNTIYSFGESSTEMYGDIAIFDKGQKMSKDHRKQPVHTDKTLHDLLKLQRESFIQLVKSSKGLFITDAANRSFINTIKAIGELRNE